MRQQPYFTNEELDLLGFGSRGDDIRVSRRASIHGAERLSLGSHVRIDDFALISCGAGGVQIGDHVHIAAQAALYGGGGIVIEDFVTVSGRSSIYSVSDDYGGDVMTNPTVPERFTSVEFGPVTLRRHVVVGAGCIVLPGVTIGEGSATGAMTLVRHDLAPWGIYVGAPARLLHARSRGLLALEAELRTLEAEQI